MAGMNVRIASPEGYLPSGEVVNRAKQLATGNIVVTSDPAEAVSGADVVTTDTWVSMGAESEKSQRIKDLEAYRVDENLFSQASPEAVFLHCLPAYRGNEVTAGVIDGERSLVWHQAENRLHAQKAVMSFLAKNS
jgi:ornithine carbamoyltransferase